MAVETVPIGSISPDPANLNVHPERSVEAIAASLRRFGQQKPVVVDGGGIIRAGNGTYAAARSLGWAEIAIVRTALRGSEATAYAIADNRTASFAHFDDEALKDTLRALEAEGFDLDAAGFNQHELDALLGELGKGVAGAGGDVPEPTAEADPDAGPEAEVEPAIRAGDRVRFGDHLLICGDSTDAATVAGLLDGAPPRLLIFDPPFDLDYLAWSIPPSVAVACLWGRSKSRIAFEAAHFLPDDAWGIHEIVFVGGVRGQHNHTLPCCLHDSVHVWRTRWWGDKMEAIDRDAIARSGCALTEDGRPRSVQDHCGGVLTGYGGMSWGKPVMSLEVMMAYVPRGSVAYDPCAGSGSSLIAAARHGRTWRGVEMQPKWAHLIADRWGKQGTGEPVVVEREGRSIPFGELTQVSI